MRCTPTIHDLIVLTLPPRHRCPLDRMPASRLLLPRSGLERSDFVLWHITSFRCAAEFDRYRGIADSGEPSARQIYAVNQSLVRVCHDCPSMLERAGLAARQW